MDINPLTSQDAILFSILTFVVFLLLGVGISGLLEEVFSQKRDRFLPFSNLEIPLLILIIFYVGVGFLGLIVILPFILLFHGFFFWKVGFLLIFSIFSFFYTFYTRKENLNVNKGSKSKNCSWEWIFNSIVLIFGIYGIFHFLAPTVGLHVYPGVDDLPRLYYSKVTVETGKLPFLATFPSYALSPGMWAFQAMPVVGAFFNIIYSTTLAKTHLFFIQFNRGLTPLFIYAFLGILLKERDPLERKLCGFFSMIGATFSRAQYRYFLWGGVGESIGFNVTLTLLMIYLILKINITKKKQNSLASNGKIVGFYYFFFLFSGGIMAYVSFRVLPLYIMGLLGILIVELVKGAKNVKLRIISLLGIIMSLYIFAIIESSFNPPLIPYNINPFLNQPERALSGEWLILIEEGDIGIFLVRCLRYLHQFHGQYLFLFLLLGVAGIFLHTRRKKDITIWYPILVTVLLFLLSQSNPHGLYYFPYPGIAGVATLDRLYLTFLLPFSMIQGIGIALSCSNMIRLLKTGTKKLKLKIAKEKWKSLTFQEISAFFLVIGFLAALAPQAHQKQIYYRYHMYEKPSRLQPITTNDLEAFQWMETKIHGKKRFLASGRHSSGRWIPIYTDQIVLPPDVIRLNPPKQENFSFLTYRLKIGSISEAVIDLLRKFEIDYIYAGVLLNLTERERSFDRSALQKSDWFDLVFESRNVMIFEFLRVRGEES